VQKVLVVRRTGDDVAWNDERDVWWHDVVAPPVDQHEREMLRRRAPAVRPVHLRHDREAQGHPAHHRWLPDPGTYTHPPSVFDLKPETTSTGAPPTSAGSPAHSYIVYGPLANGATQVIYEGTPDTPHKGRWWEIVQKYKVSIFYTAPTAIRTFMKWGARHPRAVRPVLAAAARLGR
jgi:acetyl-CoA synthetase